jgi:hypothetical protein
MTLGTVRAPTKDDLRQVASDLGMSFSDEGLAQHLAALIPSIAAFNIIGSRLGFAGNSGLG